MRITFYAVGIFAISLLSTASAFGQAATTDLSMRRALYFTGGKPDKIDTKTDRYVAENGTMNLTQSDATKCEAGGCYFNVGFIAFRQPSRGTLSTYALIQAAAGLVGNTVYFADKEGTKQGVLPVKLHVGSNKVTFQIDPYKKTPESDENNNTFSVTIVVEGKP
jgi:hypothetical protein